ncbi:hypothetical protein EDEG_00754 [Edhazardia aedis USNM 41457]|uniref:Uncharacterized protein n=1 Tax=Edhazardia aedis (strain USNM 41457) TaxID=1003232 RepID=J8ZZT0_EDHAE|nr:hypothetical protein EDEG_00754 [Edhazardia aedis USNM 41457]|eukprot:EJW05143.1 hypothetical protein EDEG_00754 [Edhazardia aedis USNM 41457]
MQIIKLYAFFSLKFQQILKITLMYEIIIIGAGSGGIAAARMASQLGTKVLLVESGRIGGTCVNVGCVPKKICSNLAQILYDNNFLHSKYGLMDLSLYKLDFKQFVEKREAFIKRLNTIYSNILNNDPNIDYIQGYAEVYDGFIKVNDVKYEFSKCILATGSKAKNLNCPKISVDHVDYVHGTEFLKNSDDFFKLDKVPKKSVIIGSGYIGIEIAFILNALGSEVHLIARGKQLLSHFDDILGENVSMSMKKHNIRIHYQTKVKRVFTDRLELVNNEKSFELNSVDFMMCAIGRDCDLSFIKCPIESNENFLVVNENFETSLKNVYALGDLIGPNHMLTPVAIFCARKLAESLSKKCPINDISLVKKYRIYENIPSVVFSHPPCASVGFSEREARKISENVIIYSSSFFNLAFCFDNIETKEKSIFKIVTINNKVVGLHLFGTGSDEIVQGFAVAMKMGATYDDFKNTIPVHPTAAEEVITMK